MPILHCPYLEKYLLSNKPPLLKKVEASLVENLGQFKRRNFTEEIGNNKNVRLIFNGQVLVKRSYDY